MSDQSPERDQAQDLPDGSPEPADSAGSSLPEVRSELRRLGYLDHQVERYLLQDVLKPERPLETLAHLAVKVGLLIGLPSALLGALVLAGANGFLHSSPFDVLPLFAHLLPVTVLGPGLSFLGLAGLFALFLRWTHLRRIEAASLGLAMVAASIAVVTAIQQVGWSSLFELPRWQLASLVALLPLFAYLVFKVVHGGLLTLAIRLTDLTPEQPSSYGRWVVLAVLLVTFLLMVPAVLEVEKEVDVGPTALPVTAGERVVLIGVDGVLPQELDYLLAAGELPSIGRLASDGVAATYDRADEAPIAFWATVATGLPSSVHGLQSLDTFRPTGVSRPLRVSGWARHYWALGVRLGWVEYRPILANSRNAWSFWELASRGGAKSLVVGWWGTFPVEPLPGLVVAHGGYQLLIDGSALAVHPPGKSGELQALTAEVEVPGSLVAGLGQALPAELRDEVVDEVVRADAFYLEVFRRHLREGPRAAAIYLAGLDIAAAKADLGSVAHGDLVRRQLKAVDKLVEDLLVTGPEAKGLEASVDVEGPITIILVADPGRRGSRRGRALIHRAAGCNGGQTEIEPEAIAATAARALGLPQSRQLPDPIAGCGWSEPSMVVDSYGMRPSSVPAGDEDSEEYLENLKSLGYL